MASDTVSAAENGGEVRPRWSLRLFGEFELTELPGGSKIALPGKRERVLLAYLAVSPNHRELRRKLVTLLWGEDSDETTLDNLRTSVFNLRKGLGSSGHQAIFSDGREIVLDASAFSVDVLEFRALAASSDPFRLQQAADLYAGEFLDSLAIASEEFESWRRDEATRCRDRAIRALTLLSAQSEGAGETERAIDAGLRVLRLEPLHEPSVRLLMRLYRDSGQRSAAIQLYRGLVEALKNELNAQPEAETRKTFAEIADDGKDRILGAAALEEPRPLPNSAPAASIRLPRQFGRAFRRRAALPILAGALIGAAAILYSPAHALFDRIVARVAAAPAVPEANMAIVVLPFANLSGDSAEKFFSDGITQDIAAALVRVGGLHVVGRDSAFRLESEKRDVRIIAEQLSASHLVEGSVRTIGQHLLITAKLIKAADGTTLWTQDYDRELTDAFAIQDQIARAIADALHAHTGINPGDNLAPGRAIDPVSYQRYLAARSLVRARFAGVPHAIDILEPVVARYPDYAPASALLASAYLGMVIVEPEKNAEYWSKADGAARRAIHSDPSLADAYVALAGLQRLRGKQIEADDLIRKALALDPDNPDVLDLYGMQLFNVGRLKEALAVAERRHALEPSVPGFNADLGRIYWVNGRNADAIRVLTPIIEFGGVRVSLAMVYASQGRYAEAADLLEHDGISPKFRDLSVAAAHILRSAPAKIPPEQMRAPLYLRQFPVGFVYVYAGAPERVLESFERSMKLGQVGGPGDGFGLLWHPSFASVRKTERFKALMRISGNVEYWRAKGWPEFCHPTTGEDFVCH